MIILAVVNGTENLLCDIAPIPIIGRVAGVVRVGLGCIETITALALAILLILPAIFIPFLRNAVSECNSYTFKGLENIIAGIFETIPFIGGIF